MKTSRWNIYVLFTLVAAASLFTGMILTGYLIARTQ